jgi:hypothetical protein
MRIRSRVISALSLMCVLAAADLATAQILHDTGQNVVPVYEGWQRNPDGTFTMVFGYFNRNLEEEPIVPVGPNNIFEPGDPDRGQPTHFYPRRQQFMFKLLVPKDWGTKELIWTLTVNGRTEKAYGTLLPIWEIGPQVYEQNRSTTLLHHKDEPINQPPSITLVSAPQATLALPETLSLTVSVGDDDLPVPSPRSRSRRPANVESRPSASPMTQAIVRLEPGWKLGVVWVHHRGPGPVTFDPVRQPIGDGTAKSGQAVTRASFSEPGTYVLRAYADDGVLMNSVDVTVVVKPGATGKAQR